MAGFKFPWKQRKILVAAASAVQQGAAIVKVPVWASTISITMNRIVTNSNGVNRTIAGADIGTVTASMDGKRYFVPNTFAGTAIAIVPTTAGPKDITSKVNYIRIVTAAIAAGETVHWDVTFTND